jgi:Protein of unknown function (DUF2946)
MFCTPIFNRFRRPLTVWLALFVALLGAVVPTVSHAVVWQQGGSDIGFEICTSDGSRWVNGGSAGAAPEVLPTDSPGKKIVHSLNHCPFCLLVADDSGPIPQLFSPIFSLDAAAAVVVFEPRFLVSALNRQTRARGPPIFNFLPVMA